MSGTVVGRRSQYTRISGESNSQPNSNVNESNRTRILKIDVDAGTNPIKMSLSVINGTLTLNGTTGLDFTGTCSGAAGDGTADTTMTFCGTLTDINNALDGMTYNPTTGFSGSADLTVNSNDQGKTGGGAQADTEHGQHSGRHEP